MLNSGNYIDQGMSYWDIIKGKKKSIRQTVAPSYFSEEFNPFENGPSYDFNQEQIGAAIHNTNFNASNVQQAPKPQIKVSATSMSTAAPPTIESEKIKTDATSLVGTPGQTPAGADITMKQQAEQLKKVDIYGSPKVSFADKYESSVFGKNSEAINAGLDGLNQAIGAQPKGDVQAGIQGGWDAAADLASSFGPYGKMVGGAMKAVNVLNSLQSKITGGTDGMTTADQILDSPLGFITGMGLINQIGGKKADTITKDAEVFADAGDSYGGTDASVNDALEKSGKKYGLFSSGARSKANELIHEAQRQQSVLSDIVGQKTMANNLVGSMAATSAANYSTKINGGYNQGAVRVGRQGMVLANKARAIITKYKQGGKSTTQEAPKKQIRTLDQIIADAKHKNPRFIQRLSEPPRGIQFTDDRGQVSRGNVYLETGSDDNGNYFIYPRIQEMEDGKLKLLNSQEAWKRARGQNNLIQVTPEEYKLFFAEDPEYGQAYKRYWPNMFGPNVDWDKDDSIIENLVEEKKNGGMLEIRGCVPNIIEEKRQGGSIYFQIAGYPPPPKYRAGGQFNIIPEGALHARLHHMEDADNLTRKGIPVVSEEDGKIQQQAEIERSEIIFRLEATKKIEDLRKKYKDASGKEKEQIAIEAGKFLTNEIMNNTIDNTNTLL